jgi:uncharacterized protein YbcI
MAAMADEEGDERQARTDGVYPTEQVERGLARELVRIHEESYGKGAREARIHLLEDTVICILDGLELLPNEEFLIDNGKADAVVDIRFRYQQAIETTFRAAVERATGRRVVSFASITKLNPNYVVEIFRLAEQKNTPLPRP